MPFSQLQSLLDKYVALFVASLAAAAATAAISVVTYLLPMQVGWLDTITGGRMRWSQRTASTALLC